MKAIFFDSPGGSDVLRYGEAEKPETNGGEVLIKVAYAGVNRADLLQRMGHYDPPPGASPLLGLEVSGTIEETGEKVCALLEGGGYAEYARVRRTQCLPIPNGLSLEQAAALPEAVFTVWKNIYSIGFLRRGETALIHGGASGIGTMAIQMIKAFGGNVIVTAGNDLKCRACKKLGADLAINYKTQDFVPLVSDFTGGKGVNVVLDMVGGDYVARNIDCLAKYGRHVSIAYPDGAKATISIPKIMQKQLILTGSTLRAAPFHEKEDLADGIREYVWPHIASGKIKPVIHKVFPLKDAAKAHEILEKGENTGKLVLKI
ncbi:MAG: NAD(P)H-quinone oxidoreductase [Alphaproteobacteria bacterium]